MKYKTLLLLFIPFLGFTQKKNVQLTDKIEKIIPQVIEWRRHFHQNPELSNREYKTGAYIADYLKSIGLEVKTPIAKTGVVAILKGGKAGPVIALRSDMDALPVTEKINLPFASTVRDTFNNQTVDVMHACGHDAHMAILMGAATILSQMKNEVSGTIVFLFQPAEEGPPENEEGGAPLMVKEGALDNPKVEAVFGLHIQSGISVGTIEYKPDAFMASSDWFTLTIKGKGSHGSQPWLGIDPIVIASQIVLAFQTIVSRQEDLTKAPVVISVGSINSGVRSNIIPDQCVLRGTIRTLDSKMRQDVFQRMKRTANSIASSAGAEADINVTEKTLVTYNDPTLVNTVLPALQAAAGKENVILSNWYTYSEDFSYYSQKAPSFFFYLGGMPKGNDPLKAPAHHTSEFYIAESGFDTGIKAFCEIALMYTDLKK